MRGRHHIVHHCDPLAHVGEEDEAQGGLTAPMPGKIVALLVEAGASVAKGDALLVLEAMTMEMTVCAPADGKLVPFLWQVGEQVQGGAETVDGKSVGEGQEG